MKTNKILSLSILLLLLITSCDCAYDYEMYVENNTNDSIFVGIESSYTGVDDVIAIPSKKTILVYSESYFPGGGCPGMELEDFKNMIDRITVLNKDSVPSVNDFNNYMDWTLTEETNYGGRFDVIVEESDF